MCVASDDLRYRNVVLNDGPYKKAQDYTEGNFNVCRSTSENENKGLVAVLDARPKLGLCDSTCLICNRLNISYLFVGWDLPELKQDEIFTFSYYPPAEVISKAFSTLIKDLQWDKFTILYENDDSFVRVQDVINTWLGPEAIVYRKLNPNGDNRETFKHIFKTARMSYHILDCDAKNTIKYFKEIVQVESSTEYLSFILTSLEAYTLNLEDNVPDLMANVSTFHMMSANDDKWRNLMISSKTPVSMETALTADALKHLEIALSRLDPVEPHPPSLCFSKSRAEYESRAWSQGNMLRENLLNVTAEGFTGHIEFDEKGRRTKFILLYSKLNSENSFDHAGSWDPITNVITTNNVFNDRSAARKTGSKIRIVSKIGKPYFMLNNINGTAEYDGYSVKLIKHIFEIINKKENQNYEYEFYVVDGYGNPVEGTKKWNGLIGELMERYADMGICDLTITSDRNKVVDFSIPFMSLGISVLAKKPEPEKPDMFSFILPLNLDVWLYLATAYIIVSFILFLCARMSQEDWVNPHPCNQNPDSYQNIWSLYNSMWLTMGSIMTQGCDILPRAAGSRWTIGVWWFFALIVTSSYTANMSTFLSNQRRSNDIENVKDLAEQNKITYGAVFNASTYKFFRDSNDSVYSKIWSVMKNAKPSVFVKNNEEGKERVLKSKGKHVFFMESTAIEYYKEIDCELRMVGPRLDSKDYGIAFPKKSPFKRKVDDAILELQEKGVLRDLKKEFWSGNCTAEGSSQDDDSLQLENTLGIFIVLAAGGVLGLITAVIDLMLHANKIAVKEKITFKEALATEWRASLDPRSMQKAAAPARSRPPSVRAQSRERSRSRAASMAASFINFDEIY